MTAPVCHTAQPYIPSIHLWGYGGWPMTHCKCCSNGASENQAMTCKYLALRSQQRVSNNFLAVALWQIFGWAGNLHQHQGTKRQPLTARWCTYCFVIRMTSLTLGYEGWNEALPSEWTAHIKVCFSSLRNGHIGLTATACEYVYPIPP